MEYAKKFTALDSEPTVLNELGCSLGMPRNLSFDDVVELKPDQEALAVILIYHTSEDYDTKRKQKHRELNPSADVFWIPQTIDNACSLYSVLHVICNDPIRQKLGKQKRDFVVVWHFSNTLQR